MMIKINPILLTAMAHQEAYDVGIVPLDTRFLHDMSRSLSQLSPEESRKLRRKFRKLWRKLAKGNNQVITASNLMLESATANHVGLGCKNPTRYHSAGRKTLVYRELQAKARKKLQNNSSSEF